MNTETTSTNRIWPYFGLGLVLLAGGWLRWEFIERVHLYPDEFVTLLAVRRILETGWPVMPSGLFYEHGLLFSYLGSGASWFGPLRWAVRSASFACGLLTLGLIFRVGRGWFSPAVGLIATVGLALAPSAIEWSGRARMYALLQLLVLLTIWLAYEGVARPHAGYRWLALLTYLGATLTHFVAVALAPPLVVAGWLVCWVRVRRNPALSWRAALPRPRHIPEMLAFGAVLLTAFWVKRAGQPKGIEALSADNALGGLAQVLAIYSEVSLDVVGSWQALAPFFEQWPALLFAGFGLVAVAGIGWRLVRRRGFEIGPGLFLAVLLGLTTLEMLFLVSTDRRDDKYLFMLLPALLLLGGWGMQLVWHRLRRGSVFAGIPSAWPALLLIGLIVSVTRPEVQARLENTGDDYEAAFSFVAEQWQPGDTIMTGTPAAAAFYLGFNDFYAVQRRGGYDYRLLTVEGQVVDRWLASPAIRTAERLHETLAAHDVWLVLERWGLQREYYDLPFQQQLLAQTEVVEEAQGIFVLRSHAHPRPVPLQPTRSVTATLGERVRLLGYNLEPESPGPGTAARLTLYWQALAPMAEDYTVFVHLRQPEGGTVAQADHRPLGAAYPTSLWPPGAVIRETSGLAMPPDLPPGLYELWLGMYLLETGERLPLAGDTSGENAVRAGTVEVKYYV